MGFDYFLQGREAFTGFLKALDTIGIEYQEERTEARLGEVYDERGYDDTPFRKATFTAPGRAMDTLRRMVVEEYVAWVHGTDDTETTGLDVIVYEEGDRPDVESLLKRMYYDDEEEDEELDELKEDNVPA